MLLKNWGHTVTLQFDCFKLTGFCLNLLKIQQFVDEVTDFLSNF